MFVSFDTSIAARTLWGEARGEGKYGEDLIVHVIRNRVRDGRWGKTMANVCLWPYQFSCWNFGDPNRAQLVSLDDNDPALMQIVYMVLDSVNESDPTMNATHYYSDFIAPPPWSNPDLGAIKTVKLGHHIFFRNVK